MKRICVVLGIGIFGLVVRAGAQTYGADFSFQTIGSGKLEVTCNKTSNIIFPYGLISVDKGSRDLLIQKARGSENILQVKAAKGGFAETNLSIVTEDGRFYSFLVNYAENPAELNLVVSSPDTAAGITAIMPRAEPNARQAEMDKQKVLACAPYLKLSATSQQVAVGLEGIYLCDGELYFVIGVANSSMIPFRPSYVRLFMEDKRSGKRTASQEKEMNPRIKQDFPIIAGGRSAKSVVAFDAFTVPRGKKLVIEVGDRPDGRNVQLKINNNVLLGARVVK